MQRRKRGLHEPGTSQGDANVVPFPARTRTDVRTVQEDRCAGVADDEQSSTRASTGAANPRSKSRSPKRKQRGPNQIGVLMPTLALPKNLSGYRPQDVGLLTHAAIAILAPHLRDLTAVTISERVLDVTGALVNGENVNRRRVLMLTAAGHTATYLRRFAPDSPWELLGCEFDTGGGRTDLAWQHSETGEVFFDEIKTHNRPITVLSAAVVAQAKRQGEGGLTRYGPAFRGVRVLPFGALHLTALVLPGQSRSLIAPTPTDPLRPRVQEDGR